jgi:hypothetical protein
VELSWLEDFLALAGTKRSRVQRKCGMLHNQRSADAFGGSGPGSVLIYLSARHRALR